MPTGKGRHMPSEPVGAQLVLFEIATVYGCKLWLEVPAEKPHEEREYLARLAARCIKAVFEDHYARPGGGDGGT